MKNESKFYRKRFGYRLTCLCRKKYVKIFVFVGRFFFFAVSVSLQNQLISACTSAHPINLLIKFVVHWSLGSDVIFSLICFLFNTIFSVSVFIVFSFGHGKKIKAVIDCFLSQSQKTQHVFSQKLNLFSKYTLTGLLLITFVSRTEYSICPETSHLIFTVMTTLIIQSNEQLYRLN